MSIMYIQTRYSIYDIQYYFICIPVIELSSEQQEFLTQEFLQILDKHNCIVDEISVLQDQVHILFFMPIDKTLKDIINVLKSHTSFLLRKKYPELKKYPTLWLKGYFIATVGVRNEKSAGRMIRKLKKLSPFSTK